MSEYFLIAKVVKIIGKNGYVQVEPYSDFPERFHNLKKVYVDFWGDKKIFFVEEIRQHKNSFSIKFKKFDNQRDSRVLEGREIFIDDKDLVELPENHFFIHDLIDSVVLKGKDKLGIVADVMKLKANDVIVIEGKDEKEILIPFVLDFIDKFDPVKKKLQLKDDIDLGLEDED